MQSVGSAGPAGTNCLKANESLRTKDFIMRIKIGRKAAKESHGWLKLYDPGKAHLFCKFLPFRGQSDLLSVCPDKVPSGL